MGFYFTFLKIHIKSMMEYRGAFISHSIAKLFGWGADFLMLFVMISQVSNLDNWGPYEMLLLFGLQLAAYSIAGFFFYNVKENFPKYIQQGELDQVLIKPVNPLFYLVCREFNTGYFSNLVVAIAAIVITFVNLEIEVSIHTLLSLILSVTGGSLIYAGIMMIQVIPSFWVIRTNTISTVDWVFQTITRYPLSIFGRVLQIALTFIIPYAFINFLPAQLFVGSRSFLGLPIWVGYMSLPVGLVFFGLLYVLWKWALNKYTGAGS